jgi:aminopeptidase N
VSPAGADSQLAEERFFSDGAGKPGAAPRWRMPLAVHGPGSPETVLLQGRTKVAGDPLVNAGALAYARVLYPPHQAAALAANIAKLADVDRLNLLNDAAALGRAGYAPPSDALAYLAGLPVTTDPIVWRRGVRLVAAIDAAYPSGGARAQFRRWALVRLAPVTAMIGLSEHPDEDANIGDLRAELLPLLAKLGDADVITWARSTDRDGSGNAADRQTALTVVALCADPAAFDALLRRVRAERDPLEKGRLMQALALVADPTLAGRFVSVLLDGEAPAGSTGNLLFAAGKNNPDTVWTALMPHLDDPALPMSLEEQLYVVPGIAAGSSRPERIEQLSRWADKHLPADTRQNQHAAEATISQNASFQARAIPDITSWLSDHGEAGRPK